jgi:hypothetical protein
LNPPRGFVERREGWVVATSHRAARRVGVIQQGDELIAVPRLSVGGFNSVGELTPTKSPAVKPGFRFGWLLVLAVNIPRQSRGL